MKKAISLVLAIVLIVSMFIVSAATYSAVDADVDKLYIKADGDLLEVSQGDIFTYTAYLYVPELKISSFDGSIEYDESGLQFLPDYDEYGDEALDVMFPILRSPIWSVKNSKISYNFSSVGGVRFQSENSVLFTGKFKITADNGIYEINSRIKTLADSNVNKLIYEYELIEGAVVNTESTVVVTQASTEIPTEAPTQAPTEAPTQAPTEAPTEAPTQAPTEALTEAPTQALTEALTEAPTEALTEAPTEAPTQALTEALTEAPTQTPTTPQQLETTPEQADEILIEAGGEYYSVSPDEIFRYTVYMTVPDVKISSIDATTYYDSVLVEIPDVDEYGDYDLLTMFPTIKNPVANFGVAGSIIYNYSSTGGVRFANQKSILFTCCFKVNTSSFGVYHINTFIKTLADSDTNIFIEDCNLKPGANVTITEVIEQQKLTDPTEYMSSEPATESPTEQDVDGLYIRADGTLIQATQGQSYTYFYYLQVPEHKISSLDAVTKYDADGLNFVADKDEYGEYDYSEMFPILPDPVCNFNEYGEILFNISKVSGVRFPNEKSVLFKGQFVVTADKGIYDIDTTISYLYDNETTGLIVDGKLQPDVVINSGTKIYDNSTKILLGDINNDGVVTILDATVLQRRLARFNITPYNEKAADVDRDGQIIIADATRIQRYIAKLLKDTDINKKVFVD